MMGNFCDFFEKRKPLKIIGMVIGGIFVAALLSFLVGWLIMLLWNWLMPVLFGLGTITYWQGFGIFFLAKLIFGFGGGHDSNSGNKKDKKTAHKGIIRAEIGSKIKKGIQKEFKKEFDKEYNEEYDDKYEDWWANEGKTAFNEYMKKAAEPNDTTDTEE